MSGFFYLLHRIARNDHKDLFVVRLGAALLLNKFGVAGFFGNFASYFIRGTLGLFLEVGIYKIDVLLDAYREGQKLEEFETLAKAAYEKATAKIYDEEKKNEIRKEYLSIISKIGVVGNGPK